MCQTSTADSLHEVHYIKHVFSPHQVLIPCVVNLSDKPNAHGLSYGSLIENSVPYFVALYTLTNTQAYFIHELRLIAVIP